MVYFMKCLFRVVKNAGLPTNKGESLESLNAPENLNALKNLNARENTVVN